MKLNILTICGSSLAVFSLFPLPIIYGVLIFFLFCMASGTTWRRVFLRSFWEKSWTNFYSFKDSPSLYSRKLSEMSHLFWKQELYTQHQGGIRGNESERQDGVHHTFKAPTSSLTPPLVGWVDEKGVLRKEGASFPALQRAGKFSVVPSIEL